ncbi:hypothetical protein ACIGG9_26910 [Pseudonocardia alni]|uniref:hypothetical protein n=1 Tax=Pseudonocardia alni TaxID=33907 RepID=UPI0033F9CA4F
MAAPTRPARLNRTLLALIGLTLLAAGAFGLGALRPAVVTVGHDTVRHRPAAGGKCPGNGANGVDGYQMLPGRLGLRG